MTFDLSAALEALRGRMQTNPSEFFEDAYRWNFLKSESIREVLTEDELKLLAEGLIYVRRADINNRILHSLLEDSSAQEYESVRYGPSTTTTGFGQAAIKQESASINAALKNQMEQLKYDMARQQNQQQYGSALGQNTPSQYLKSFFK